MAGAGIPTRTVRRSVDSPTNIQGDICVVGSGAAGLSAALEAAREGKRVVQIGRAHV